MNPYALPPGLVTTDRWGASQPSPLVRYPSFTGGHNRCGYTLPELLLTLLLLTWLGLHAGPGVRQLWLTQQLRQEAALVLQQVQEARHQAMGQLQDVYLGVQSNCLWQAAEPQAGCQATNQRWQQPPWQLQADFGASTYVRFSAGRGMAGFSSGRFRLWHPAQPDHQVHIIVSSLGRVRWCQQGAGLSGVPPCA